MKHFLFELDHWLFYFHILMCYRIISHIYAPTYVQRHTKESFNSVLNLKPILGKPLWPVFQIPAKSLFILEWYLKQLQAKGLYIILHHIEIIFFLQLGKLLEKNKSCFYKYHQRRKLKWIHFFLSKPGFQSFLCIFHKKSPNII